MFSQARSSAFPNVPPRAGNIPYNSLYACIHPAKFRRRWPGCYEVGRALQQLDDGDWMVEITMIETGEKAQHRLTQLNDDPAAL